MTRSTVFTVLRVTLLWAAGISVLFPIVWIALASLKTPQQLNDPFLFAFSPDFASWQNVLASGILGAAGRSAVVALVTVGISAGRTSWPRAFWAPPVAAPWWRG